MRPRPAWRPITRSIAGLGPTAQWTVLLVLSGLLVLALEAVQLPAALLLGSMFGGIFLAAAGATLRLPRWPQFAAQAVIGCLIARSFTPSLVAAMLRDWPLFLASICGVIGASCFLGWLLARLRALPGTAAVWGSFPGAATAMINYYRSSVKESSKQAKAGFPPISAPTLVIWGQRDGYLGEQLAEPDHEDVPGLDRVERLEDASHWVHHDEAEQVNRLLIDFFA